MLWQKSVHWLLLLDIGAVILISFFAFPGYEGLDPNHDVSLAPLFHRLDPTLFPHADHLERVYGDNSFFLDLLQVLLQTGINLFVLMFILMLLARLAFLIAFYFIALYFTNNRFFSAFALFFAVQGSFGHFLSYATLAYSSGFMFLALFLYGKRIWSIIPLCFSFMMAPVTAISFFLFLGFVLMLDIKDLFFQKRYSSMLQPFIIGLLLLSFFIVFFSLKGGDDQFFARYDAVALKIEQQSSENIFLTRWSYAAYISTIAWVLLGTLSIGYFQEAFQDKERRKMMLIFLAVPLVSLVVSFVGGDLLLVRGIATLQLFRSMVFLRVLFPIFLCYGTFWFIQHHFKRKLEVLLWVAVNLWLILRIGFVFLPEGMILFLPPLLILLLGNKMPALFRHKDFIPYAAVVLLFVEIVVVAQRLVYWHRIASLAFFLFLCGLALLIAMLIGRIGRSYIERFTEKRATFVASSIGVFVFILAFMPVYAEPKIPSIYPSIWSDRPWMELCDWVIQNTDRADVFITEPFVRSAHVPLFRLTCMRDPFLITAETTGLYVPNTAAEWQRRVISQKLLAADPQYILQLKSEYAVHYILADRAVSFPASISLVFSNEHYYLYKI